MASAAPSRGCAFDRGLVGFARVLRSLMAPLDSFNGACSAGFSEFERRYRCSDQKDRQRIGAEQFRLDLI
jgi:hypothetical protein